jgi:succinate dehydrogenase / fumarate reductase cytochrome b subunit
MVNSHQESQLTLFVKQLHRLTGIGVFLFLAIHLLHIWLMGLGPEPFNTVTAALTHPIARLLHLGLFFSLLFHALNGARLAILDLSPGLTRYRRLSIFLTFFLVAALFIPSTLIIVMDTFLPSL